MTPAESEQVFRSFAKERGDRVEWLRAVDGARLMTDFFEFQAASTVQPEDGDMLLFQWGTHDWGDGRHFEVDFTRQFIDIAFQDDDAISQLHLTFCFIPDPDLEALQGGDLWCKTKEQLPEFRSKIFGHAVLSAVSLKRAMSVRLAHNFV